MASIARNTLRTALHQPSSFASTSAAVASSSKLPSPSRSNSTVATPLGTPSSDVESEAGPTPVQYSYFVPRVGKTLSSLPVYTDVRNGGTRTMTEVRKIQGSISDLKTDLSLFLAESYADAEADMFGQEVNKKPLRVKPGRKMLARTGNPSYLDPVQTGKVVGSGKIKIRGNRVDEVRAFLESRGF
ncbi:Ribosomal protein L49/IMG2 [Kalmanozyma brasiliensis GHG001]|uniref:Large ribosomal subunit protein mL49 n=1 Tax=Kalmanozyma brasiliensis (strain GHG001) TaxID=1365824 RepID=V5GL46_KALBG|nr:Ribosomal protein L49/IMG2 [Kalmanozyma brasiliensis GHG001]EST06677.1 Ribosomal protein L49/IMG2 [Kalmanozyma brasiliensis GHG001]